jgi:hypothetical protein
MHVFGENGFERRFPFSSFCIIYVSFSAAFQISYIQRLSQIIVELESVLGVLHNEGLVRSDFVRGNIFLLNMTYGAVGNFRFWKDPEVSGVWTMSGVWISVFFFSFSLCLVFSCLFLRFLFPFLSLFLSLSLFFLSEDILIHSKEGEEQEGWEVKILGSYSLQG